MPFFPYFATFCHLNLPFYVFFALCWDFFSLRFPYLFYTMLWLLITWIDILCVFYTSLLWITSSEYRGWHRMEVVIRVACVVNWISIFICQIIVVPEFFYLLTWKIWPDWAVSGIAVFPPLLLGHPFHRDFIGQALSTDGCCG